MSKKIERKSEAERAASIVRDAGGRVVGRTRLQKIAYLLEIAGLGEGFSFEYRHYGPYSESLSAAVERADVLDLLDEEEHSSSWGGFYSIYTTVDQADADVPSARRKLIRAASNAGAIELELAATAAFLSSQGEERPWEETALLKPDKASAERLIKAKALYKALRKIETPEPLPDIC